MEGWLEGKIKIRNIENSEEFFDYLFGTSYLFELMVSENQLEYKNIKDSVDLVMSDDVFNCVRIEEFLEVIKAVVSSFPSLIVEVECTENTSTCCEQKKFKILYSEGNIKFFTSPNYYILDEIGNYFDYVSECEDNNITNVLSEEEWNVRNGENDEWYIIDEREISNKIEYTSEKIIKVKPKIELINDLTDGAIIKGDLVLGKIRNEKLPKNLTVKGNLDLSDTKIKELPEGLTVSGNLNLTYSEIKELPEGLTVGGDLNIVWTEITKLPKDLTIGGGLDLGISGITELPKGLTVNGDLDLSVTPIAELPEGLTVKGDLNLSHTPIAELPEDLIVGGDLILSSTLIAKLPEGLTVKGDLDLTDTPIIKLPEDLTVNGNLVLDNTPITKLPKGLTVGGDLDLGYTKITELSEDLTVGGKIISLNNF